MAALWSLPEIHHWWLPNDEGCPQIVRSIRSFVDERATEPPDSPSSDLKEMKGIFRAMKLGDDDKPKCPTITEHHTHHQLPLESASASEHGTAAHAMSPSAGPVVWSGSPEAWELPQNPRS
jgi:hypothetical protein